MASLHPKHFHPDGGYKMAIFYSTFSLHLLAVIFLTKISAFRNNHCGFVGVKKNMFWAG